MFCHQCGAAIDDRDDRFCSRCGAPLHREEEIGGPVPQSPLAETPADRHRRPISAWPDRRRERIQLPLTELRQRRARETAELPPVPPASALPPPAAAPVPQPLEEEAPPPPVAETPDIEIVEPAGEPEEPLSTSRSRAEAALLRMVPPKDQWAVENQPGTTERGRVRDEWPGPAPRAEAEPPAAPPTPRGGPRCGLAPARGRPRRGRPDHPLARAAGGAGSTRTAGPAVARGPARGRSDHRPARLRRERGAAAEGAAADGQGARPALRPGIARPVDQALVDPRDRRRDPADPDHLRDLPARGRHRRRGRLGPGQPVHGHADPHGRDAGPADGRDRRGHDRGADIGHRDGDGGVSRHGGADRLAAAADLRGPSRDDDEFQDRDPEATATAASTGATGIQVVVASVGGWSGTIGQQGETYTETPVVGNGTQIRAITGPATMVTANIQKLDQGTDPLEVRVERDGVLLKRGLTTDPAGIVALSVQV